MDVQATWQAPPGVSVNQFAWGWLLWRTDPADSEPEMLPVQPGRSDGVSVFHRSAAAITGDLFSNVASSYYRDPTTFAHVPAFPLQPGDVVQIEVSCGIFSFLNPQRSPSQSSQGILIPNADGSLPPVPAGWDTWDDVLAHIAPFLEPAQSGQTLPAPVNVSLSLV